MHVNILIVDDDLKIADLLKIHFMSLSDELHCKTVTSCTIALEMLSAESFDIVVADYRMPDLSGIEFFRRVTSYNPEIVKILFSGFSDLSSLEDEMTKADIAYFISKPWQLAQLRIMLNSAIKLISRARTLRALEETLRDRDRQIIKLDEHIRRNLEAEIASVGEILEQSSRPLARHCRRVAVLTAQTASRMNLSPAQMDTLQLASLCHDFGLALMPEHLRTTPEAYLSGPDQKNYRNHPQTAVRILRGLDGFNAAMELVTLHHENFDGSGYLGLKGDNLPIEARILRLCDYYDEETQFNGQAHQDLLRFMKTQSGKIFDPAVLEVFESFMNKAR